ncbi:MAG: aminotransferase class V-fold PLP-dependent enzyme [Thermomicrobiales bacterium]|jgi:cysteine desulfurase|nr:MAG: aminotransferase class V-fold PLP-dependent enzyme [Thermomicrobiales bacterium]
MSGTPAIYLDNNATTVAAPEAVAAMLEVLHGADGNPSSSHAIGQAAKMRVSAARADVARLVGASPAEIVFTASATEANHHALLGAITMNPARQHVVLSAIEHPSSLALVGALAAQGVRHTLVPAGANGVVDPDAIEAAIEPGTALVSVMWANNETGVIQPVYEIAAIARRKGALFHTDAVQAVGRVPVDFAELGADLLALSGHKLHGPKGIGALVVRKGLRLPPLVHGHQERGRRGGTENVPGIAGLAVAARLALERLDDDGVRIARLRDRLQAGLLSRIPGAQVSGGEASRLPNTLNLRFGLVDGEVILDRLDKLGVCASSGSACTAAGTAPSHVLLAMGQTRDQARAAIRLSLSRATTDGEIERVIEILPGIVRPLLSVERAA